MNQRRHLSKPSFHSAVQLATLVDFDIETVAEVRKITLVVKPHSGLSIKVERQEVQPSGLRRACFLSRNVLFLIDQLVYTFI